MRFLGLLKADEHSANFHVLLSIRASAVRRTCGGSPWGTAAANHPGAHLPIKWRNAGSLATYRLPTPRDLLALFGRGARVSGHLRRESHAMPADVLF
jgi:hypothetical protein